MDYMMLAGYRGESMARLVACQTVWLPKEKNNANHYPRNLRV
jgi:hypothetical protein